MNGPLTIPTYGQALDEVAAIVANHAATLTATLNGRGKADDVDVVLGRLRERLDDAVTFGRRFAETTS